jgi:hypothetical protein
MLQFNLSAAGTIRPSAFIIPQLAFTEPTTASSIITQANAYELNDWAVWENRTFYYAPRDTFSRKWRVRISDSNLQETGPQTSRLFNGVVVTYTDVSGLERSVGPPGSSTNLQDPSLLDTRADNPCNEVLVGGQPLRRWAVLQMGTTSTPQGAIQTGQKWLQEQRLIDHSGQATLSGHIQEVGTGIFWPVWMVRAGDLLTFPDGTDTGYRRIVRTDYSHDQRQNAIQLDAPPDGMGELLARMAVAVQGLGFGIG